MLGLFNKVSSTNELKEQVTQDVREAREKQNISFLPLTITGSSVFHK